MIRFDGQVAIVTGGAAGLGRSHALGLAARGARVLVADMAEGAGVVSEIEAAGGTALATRTDVSDEASVAEMVAAAMSAWGHVDILVNNAGLLRDKSFAKMEISDWRRVIDVHLTGSALCTHALWPHFRERQYGRVVFTTSGSGLYGNFGQANYAAAKAGMVGLMNTLHLEGARYGIRVNCLAPTAATAMTDGLLPEDAAALLTPESITPGLLWLVSPDAPSRTILAAGGGVFSVAQLTETLGLNLAGGEITPEAVAEGAALLTDPDGAEDLPDAFSQTRRFAAQAAEARGLPLDWKV
ncbi:SDR family NAD(P)-dependent oxidoreductase [Vannielia litorea]|uniref:SDR family NAD(P)-dependent oxidoreductase n=1 Tax=Vannielia litorea TaxID=1217970 RepID=UPI001C942A8E|nr:SDR family NAD(P)-dependent oxidoreductase [Vannielia litorea]MBY6047825.1 SDR family NAD(P)-dependent oxidoreductase [Vannielia litorea]MBY6075239.1 SDR family NAD(P)-dependent oxidoreductase [Vannielia litorea]